MAPLLHAGTKRIKYLEQNVAAFGISKTLTKQELADLEAAVPKHEVLSFMRNPVSPHVLMLPGVDQSSKAHLLCASVPHWVPHACGPPYRRAGCIIAHPSAVINTCLAPFCT